MNHPPGRGREIRHVAPGGLAVVLGIAVAACGGGSAATPSRVAPNDPLGSPSMAAPGSETPSRSGDATPGAPGQASGTVSPDVSSSRPPDDPRVTAELRAPGLAGAVGVLGSWTLDAGGSDSPWLPWRAAGAVTIPAGGPVTIRFVDGSPIGWWSVDLADRADSAGLNAQRLGGRDVDRPPLDSIRLDQLPAGTYVLAARLFRADGRGDGLTYWSIAATP